MNVPLTLLRAAWIAPMDAPIIRDGAIVFRERILALGNVRQLKAQYPDALETDLGDSIILPGLVNAHVHLELSNLPRRPLPAGGFVDWLLDVINRRQDTSFAQATEAGVRQCIGFGVTSAGDITSQPAASRDVLADGPLNAVSFGEVQSMARRRDLLSQRLAAAMDDTWTGARLRIGVSPHAPYTCEPEAYRACLRTGLPLATHLAESPHEAEFLEHHTGPFRELWEALGWWDDLVPRFTGGPIRYARSLELLDRRALLAHVNYCDDDELAILARGNASVVYCPRTHEYFRHPPHRWREMLAAGINVAIGTDSVASAGDLNLVEDLRLLHRIAPQVPAQTLWEMSSVRAARAIGREDEVGSLTTGKSADLTVWAATDLDDPLKGILESRQLPARVYRMGVI